MRPLLPLLFFWLVAALLCALPTQAGAADPELARKALAILEANCSRCHGKDNSNEGGMNYILAPAKLVARRKIVPGNPGKARRKSRACEGDMPPEGEQPRPSRMTWPCSRSGLKPVWP